MAQDILTIEPKSPMEKAAHLVKLEALKKQITVKIDEYRESLLATTRELDVLSLKTGSYTISRVQKKLPRVEDFERLKVSLEVENIPYGTKEVFQDYMTVVFKQLLLEGRELDGLGVIDSEYIMVRITEPKVKKVEEETNVPRRQDHY